MRITGQQAWSLTRWVGWKGLATRYFLVRRPFSRCLAPCDTSVNHKANYMTGPDCCSSCLMQLLLHAINTFNADVVLVLGQVRLSLLRNCVEERLHFVLRNFLNPLKSFCAAGNMQLIGLDGRWLVQEKLYSMLRDVLKGRPGVDIVKLHKSGGVVNRNNKYRQRTRVHKTRVGIFTSWRFSSLPPVDSFHLGRL